MVGYYFSLLIRNSLDALLKVFWKPHSTLPPSAANTWQTIWPDIMLLNPGFREIDNSSIEWLSQKIVFWKKKRHHIQHFSHELNTICRRDHFDHASKNSSLHRGDSIHTPVRKNWGQRPLCQLTPYKFLNRRLSLLIHKLVMTIISSS